VVVNCKSHVVVGGSGITIRQCTIIKVKVRNFEVRFHRFQKTDHDSSEFEPSARYLLMLSMKC
jgi:hypothetical protein